jgi:hypothetical protein
MVIPAKPWRRKKSTAYHGLMARNTEGSRRMPPTPSAPRHTNQTAVTGPNTAATPAVPRRWKKNSPRMIRKAIGTTRCSSAGVAMLSPSTAPSTEMAGVMMPSP